MKICPLCGAQIDDNATVCPMCNAQLNTPQQTAPAQPVAPAPQVAPAQPATTPAEQPKKKSKVGLIIGIVIGVIIVIAIIGKIAGGSSDSTDNANVDSDIVGSDTVETTDSASEAELIKGRYVDEAYENDLLGIHFSQQIGWEFSDYDTISTSVGATIDPEIGVPAITNGPATVYYTMQAVNATTNENIILLISEKITDESELFSVEEYSKSSTDKIKDQSPIGVTDIQTSFEKLTIGSLSYDCSKITYENGTGQIYAVALVDGHYVTIISTSQNSTDKAYENLNAFIAL